MSARLDLVVRGGTVVTAEATFTADVGVRGERIAELGEGLSGARVVDATGLLVMPGAIDPHTHFDTRIGGDPTADDYESGSRAAAAGGITTFVNFAFQEAGASLRETVEIELAKAEGRAHLDFALHVVVTDPDRDGLAGEVRELVADGFPSLKVFTAVQGLELRREQMLRVFQAAADAGAVVAVHAEDGPLVTHLTQRLLAAGRAGVEHLPAARPPESEALAVAGVCVYGRATGCPLYIVHLSCAAALDEVRTARGRGALVYVETRPAYLYLDDSVYSLPDREGNKFVTWPPLRTPEDQRALWGGHASGEIQTYATDHTTWMRAQKMAAGRNFDQIPGGIANVQTSIGMLYSEGVGKRRISANRFVQVASTNPARLFGLWPRKGTIAIGSDADLVLIDPQRTFLIAESEMESRSDFDPYDGRTCQGWPVLTISRGEVLVEEGRVLSRPGRGRLLRRGPFEAP
jgi:dihydropyrimidinase